MKSKISTIISFGFGLKIDPDMFTLKKREREINKEQLLSWDAAVTTETNGTTLF